MTLKKTLLIFFNIFLFENLNSGQVKPLNFELEINQYNSLLNLIDKALLKTDVDLVE